MPAYLSCSGFAALPKLIEDPDDRTTGTTALVQLTPSTEALLAQVTLPPRPSEITDDFDIEALERQLKSATTVRPTKSNPQTPGSSSSSLLSSSSSSRSSMDMQSDPLSSETRSKASSPAQSLPTDVIRRLHANLEQRLQPFWSSVLPNRIIRLHLFASPSALNPNANQSDKLTFDHEHGPLASQDVITGVDGSFHAKFRLTWDELRHHPQALHIAFGEDVVEDEVMVLTQLLPPTPTGCQCFHSTSHCTLHHNQTSQLPKPLTSISVIPITYSPIRVISDIDDTIKSSNILSGARAVFQNVFVKELKDSVIPGMGEWYREMWCRGIRFHYVVS